MQSTVSEHASSGLARERCGTCHTPNATEPKNRHTVHTWRGAADADFVRGAVDVAAARTPDGLRLVFRRRALGHAFPTGDAFRRLRVRARVLGPDHLVFEDKTVFLERHSSVVAVGLATRRMPTFDDRPLMEGDTTAVDIRLTSPGGAIAWQVTYERVLIPGARDEDAVIDGTIEIAEGRIDP
jgi:hypothetical protein